MNDRKRTGSVLRNSQWREGVAFLVILAGIDWFLPPRVRGSDMDLLRRARLVVAFAWSLFFLAIIFATVHILLNSLVCASALGLGGCVGIVCLYFMRRTGSCFVTGNLIAAVFFAVLTVLGCRLGGHGSLGLAWYVAIPVVALFTAGRPSGIFWLAATASSVGAFFAAELSGYAFPHDLPSGPYAFVELLSLINLIALMLGLALLSDMAKNQMLWLAEDSQQRYRAVVEDTPLLICTHLPDTTLTFVNEAYCRYFQRPRGELIGRPFLDLVPKEEQVAIHETIANDTATPQVHEHRAIASDGTERWLRWTTRVILDQYGEGTAHQAIGEDITERKRAEEALERRVLALTRPLEDAENITFDELFSLDDIQRLQDDFAKATGVASIITQKDGTPITAPSNFCRLCRDIIRKTEKGCANCHKSDAVLGRFNLNGPNIQPCMSGGLWDAGAAISVGGKHVANWLIGQVRDEVQTEAEMAAYAREIDADEGAFIEAFREVPTMSREQFGRIAQVLFTLANQLSTSAYQNVQQARFITERRRNEVELAKARDDAEAATQAKSEFLANMSHEIRTPMTAILGFSEILMGTEMGQEQLDAAAIIKRNGEYLTTIINDILDLSKIEAGKLEVEHVPCRLRQILPEVGSLMQVRAHAKNLSLEIEYEGPIPDTIQSDPIRLRQILINLIGNAIKFTEVGKVRVMACVLNVQSEAPKLQVQVIDLGIGMSKDQTAKLFKPFSQVDSSATRRHGGTGLGLAISKRLTEQLGGDIVVNSTLGTGSTFTMTVNTGPLDGVEMHELAADICTSFQSHEKADHVPVTMGCRVLLAEDGPDNQRLIAFILNKAGMDVVVADNGQIAYDLALAARDDGTPFDVILMDMQMPVMDGYDATSQLRKAGYTGPIIALTAHAMSTDRQKCLSSGCSDYMTKPIDRRKLISLVSQYARSPGPRGAVSG